MVAATLAGRPAICRSSKDPAACLRNGPGINSGSAFGSTWGLNCLLSRSDIGARGGLMPVLGVSLDPSANVGPRAGRNLSAGVEGVDTRSGWKAGAGRGAATPLFAAAAGGVGVMAGSGALFPSQTRKGSGLPRPCHSWNNFVRSGSGMVLIGS